MLIAAKSIPFGMLCGHLLSSMSKDVEILRERSLGALAGTFINTLTTQEERERKPNSVADKPKWKTNKQVPNKSASGHNNTLSLSL